MVDRAVNEREDTRMKDKSGLRLRCLIVLGVCLFGSAFAAQVRADGDIVYAARVYTQPGKGVSQWHLYRINPDGSGKRQITSGRLEDNAPRWSPDGRQIAFVRSRPTATDAQQQAVCLVGANGGAVSMLYTAGKDDYLDTMQWSPDSKTIAIMLNHSGGEQTPTTLVLVDAGTGKHRIFVGKSGSAWSPDSRNLFLDGGGLLDVASGKITNVSESVAFAFWPSANTICGLYADQNDGKQFLKTLDAAGHEQKRVRITESGKDEYLSSRIDGVIPIPHDSHNVILKVDNSNSTTRPLYTLCRVDTESGQLSALCEGQFLRFAPDGKRFCTAPGRDLGPYGKNKEGKPRTVWVAPLQIGQTAIGKLRAITPGTLWVTSADWRGAYPPR